MNELVKREENQLNKIVEYFENKGIIDFFVNNCGYDKETVCKRALEFMTKVSSQDLAKAKDDKYNQLSRCNSASIQKVFMSLLAWNLPSDNRDLFYLYNKNDVMTVETSYKGLKYVASLNGVECRENLIFEGDTVEIEETESGDKYTIKRGNPFERKNIIGCLVWTCKDGGCAKVYLYSFEELEKSRQASIKKMWGTESPAWKLYPNDMYLKCGIRKALKLALSEVELKSEVRAIFEDEVQEIEISPKSEKTSGFSSIENKKEKFEELKQQFDVREEL